MRCTSIKKNNCRISIELELTNHGVWCITSILHGDMIHRGFDKRIWLLPISIAMVVSISIPIAIAILPFRARGCIVPCLVALKACHLTEILPIAAIPIAVLMPIVFVATMVMTVIVVAIIVIRWW